MKAVNPAICLPPGDQKGFGASEELLEQAAKLLVFEYALLQNIKKENLGFLVASSKRKRKKNWVRKMKTLCHQMIAREMRLGSKCYGVAHSTFTYLFILDVDNPETGDCDLLEGGLRAQEWKYKKFHSGRGRHIWVFFERLPKELLSEYRSGPLVMKAVAQAFLSQYMDGLQGNVDSRGCSGQLIKLPLQFDPYYRRIILPYDENNELICDFERAVDFASDIRRNDSGQLIEFLRKYDHQSSRKTRGDRSRHGNISCHSSIDESFQEWLSTVRVGPGESNDFMFHFALGCWHAGLTQQQSLDTAKSLYINGRSDGRVTCKDTWPEWRSKLIGRLKRLRSLNPEKKPCSKVEFYEGDLAWIAKHARLSADSLFLAIHLWASRLSGSDTYHLSRRTAEKWGITERRFRNATDRFRRSGLLEIVTPGKQAPPTRSRPGRATTYRLLEGPSTSGAKLDVTDPVELLYVYLESVNREEGGREEGREEGREY